MEFFFVKFKMYCLEIIRNYICIFSLGACILILLLFVTSLYIWKSPLNRNHPTTIKRRFCSVFVVMVASALISQTFLVIDKFQNVSFTESLGIRLTGLFSAMVFPLLLTMVLFIGPLVMHGFKDCRDMLSRKSFTFNESRDLIWIRNIVVAPISEEFTFRACMMPLLIQCFPPMTAAYISGLFFGLGHVHHMWGRFRAGYSINIVLFMTLSELIYTAVFGAYSAFLFARTGHFAAPVVVHSFCNFMGFPEFDRIFTYKNPKKMILIFLFMAGIVFWGLLLIPLTNHKLYNNTLFWTED